MHPRPSPIAAALYTLRDMNADVIILHGPHGCCFRTGRLLENDGVRIVTTAMSENDFIFGAGEKLEKTLLKVEKMFSPDLVGIVGTCASMIIGEDLKEAVQNANIKARVLSVEAHGGFGEGDNTEGAIMVLESALKEGVLANEEVERQIQMLKMATEVEKTRGMAQGEYIAPSWGDDKEKVAIDLLNNIKNDKKVAIVLNAKKETSYLFADIMKIDYTTLNPNNPPLIIANLDDKIGLPRIRAHARNIINELKEEGIHIDYCTGGLDEYPHSAKLAAKLLKQEEVDFAVIAGVPHALPIENLDLKSVAVTDGPRLVEPLKKLGYDQVVAELDAHAKTLGTDSIVKSDFGTAIKKLIQANIKD